ncbi:MAG: acyl carrier protein [Clostridia bacterium]|jgi:acyl carrier protein|nr:acyl carrier protein [Clostridia bacterium]MCI9459194.1 acyl carrier protein [Clostridia bacterium]
MFELIQKQLAEYFELEPSKITPDTDFVKDLGADSLAVMELMFKLESETGKTIEDDVMDSVKTVGDLVNYLEK